MSNLEKIKSHPTYKQVLSDSCGGLMYDVSKQGSYDAAEVLAQWDAMSESEQSAAGGIMRGAMSFLKGE